MSVGLIIIINRVKYNGYYPTAVTQIAWNGLQIRRQQVPKSR
jgi:hypothetical protein